MTLSTVGYFLTGLLFVATQHCLVKAAATGARTFTDDLGVVHTFTKKKPKVVAWSHVAISLAHLGKILFRGYSGGVRQVRIFLI